MPSEMIGPDSLTSHPYSVHASACVDQAILSERVKAGWVAMECLVSEGCLANYRSGSRPVPLAFAALFDSLMAKPVLLQWLANVEGFSLVPKEKP